MTDGYYRHPAIQGDRVVFACEDDLWTVPVDGGFARRLTSGRAQASFPCLGPDGSRIAFTGREDGPPEVYVMDAAGGEPVRRTWLGCDLRTVGWSGDGRRVVFQSNFGRPFAADFRLHEVRADGGRPEPLPFGPAREIAREPGGKGIVLGRHTGDPARWKRYRGGTAGTLWIDRKGTGDFAPLLALEGNIAGPMWIGRRLFFLSDHEGWGNLYSCTPAGGDLTRHTHHEGFYVRFPSTDGRRIAYHAGADLFVFDPRNGKERRIDVKLSSPRTGRARRFVQAADHLEGAELHPKGHSLACTVRGGLYTFALWEGAPLRHGEPSKARFRLAQWLPDGERLVAVSDATGEETLCVLAADGTGRPKRIGGDLGRVVDLAVAPAGADRAAVANHRNELFLADLKAGKARRIDRNAFHRMQGLAWSPDGRWLAYGCPASRNTCGLKLLDTRDGKVHALTRPEFWDFCPSFDPKGRYLYFLGRRVFDPVYDGQVFDLGFPRGVRPYVLPLAEAAPSPFDLAARPPRPPGENDEEKEKQKRRGPEPVTIALRDIADRVSPFPVPEARYTRVAGGHGRVFLLSLPIEGSLDKDWELGEPEAKAKLEVWKLDADKKETIKDGLTTFRLSGDAKVLLLREGNELRALAASIDPKEIPSKEDPGRATGWIDLERLRAAVVPGDEWRQMFREAWRLQRDQFWTPDMARIDWEAVHDRYLPLVDRVATRAEFSDLLWEMQGELGTSHCYELGGDYRPTPRWHQGFLGADLEYGGKPPGWRVVRIPRGDPWTEDARSPVAAPGAELRPGDRILAVDGRAVGADLSPQACLVNLAGKPVRLTVRRGTRTRQVTVEALRSESKLRYRDWVEANRARVHEATKGRVGYLHIPDMGPRGWSEFHRYYRLEVDRDGLIVDVRYNGGGHVSSLLLQKLARRRLGYDLPRWMGRESYPTDAPCGPMAAVTNEYAGSDGDMFSHAFKMLGLGPLIGKRTWGGVVGIWPRHTLVDGTLTTQPEFAFWFEDVGFGLENRGAEPDVEVDIAPQDYAAGRDPQLARAIDEVMKRVRAAKPKLPPTRPVADLAPPRLPK